MIVAVGTVREHDGQRFECVSIEPYLTNDGRESPLAVWTGECARCGEPFVFRRPASAKWWEPNRRCEKHKRPGSKVKNLERRKISSRR